MNTSTPSNIPGNKGVQRPHYFILVVALTFISLLVSAGVRATPGVLMIPLQNTMGWSRSGISLAAGMGIFLYGFVGPFSAALMQAIGIRRTLIGAFLLIGSATLLSLGMTRPWQFLVTWGLLTGLGTGAVAMVFGATVVNRWFVTRRGTVMGLLAASTATGSLLFLPALASLAQHEGWRGPVLVVAIASLVMVPIVAFFMPEHPADCDLVPHGAPHDYVPPARPTSNPVRVALEALANAVHRRDFWLMVFTFFVCGFTTNGLIGTHFIAICADHGIGEVPAAGYLALMGLFDLFGTTFSGWLTDRYDARWLLFSYYGLRGLSLIALPFCDFSTTSMMVFGAFYGLDWIATLPPTLRLANAAFGERSAPVVFGWILFGHQIGAAFATFLAGVLRQVEGSYRDMLVLAGVSGILAAIMATRIGRKHADSAVAASAL
ncbi:MFS transporter [Acetobacter sp.]|jgi:predicted MFS family arabinose efflux permease|uniref:MFS transporter n=1 Tax=Acetobacter sp. TaxID=440 RepID=UPI0025C42886|nr:MFS transporter [Acetobacter sp.]MCH4091624.1 MFS transporter [Acetobacter sp.]MCI1301188.1 MFS transporter [Acetobacter sp.]MCI1317408.1 MFS transporter [Acetobacter sp.]